LADLEIAELQNILKFVLLYHNSDGILMGYRLDSQGLIPGTGKRFFSTPQHPDQLWSPPSFLSKGHWRAPSMGIKWLGHEADHSPPSNA
jgi:hypothetical protein